MGSTSNKQNLFKRYKVELPEASFFRAGVAVAAAAAFAALCASCYGQKAKLAFQICAMQKRMHNKVCSGLFWKWHLGQVCTRPLHESIGANSN